MTLPAFAAERRAAAPLLLLERRGAYCTAHLLQARRAAIDRYLLPARHSAANPPLLRSIDGTDRQTDGRTDALPSVHPSVRLSHRSTTEAGCGGFAAQRRAGRTLTTD